MADFDTGATLADRFRRHAGRDTHLYGYLMREMADDLDSGGIVAQICSGYEGVPEGSAIQLRILASVFRLVLTGMADDAIVFYPVLGGQGDPSLAWPVVKKVLEEHQETIHSELSLAPQTNEAGRSSALLVGISTLRDWGFSGPLDLRELGASAGLNLLLPHYRMSGRNWDWGDPHSELHIEGAVEGEFHPRRIALASARGCDISPVNLGDPQGRLWLKSFVWPFSVHRHDRMERAFRVAREHPPVVDSASAEEWLPHALDSAPNPVVWHSITQLYWPAAVSAAVDRIIAEYGRHHPVGRVSMEYEPGERMPLLAVEWWPGDGSVRTAKLGTVHPHGVPVRMW